MHRTLAEESVNIIGLRKNPAKYFIDQPVAVLSNNRLVRYLLNASVFEALMDMSAGQKEKKPIKARFRPSAARLEEVTCHVEQYLSDMTDDNFSDLKE